MKVISHVIYRQNGGSGFNVTYNEAMAMPWDEILWFAERLNDNREAEARASKGGQ